MNKSLEETACTPIPVNPSFFNLKCKLPYGLNTEHIHQAMNEFLDFLGFINRQLYTKGIPRLESFLMPANFSSIVGEFMNITIPKYCLNLVKNQYHNGHPDLIPKDKFPNNAVQYSKEFMQENLTKRIGHFPEDLQKVGGP